MVEWERNLIGNRRFQPGCAEAPHSGNDGGPLRMLHENLEKAYGGLGFLVAYDGMEFEV